MEDLRVENTVPRHATAGEPAEAAEVVGDATEEKLENAGGDNIGHEIAKDSPDGDGDDHGVAVESVSDGSGGSEAVACSEMPPEYSIAPPKRGRGRPKGSGNRPNLAASLDGIFGETAGRNFTPHTISIEQGENIVQRIRSFSQMTPDSICIMSAYGTISSAEIFMPSSHGGILRYEGEFTIVHLNGSHTYVGGINGPKKCLLSVQLADSEGRFLGGAVAGSLIAAGPTQVIVATFSQNLRRRRTSRIAAQEIRPLAAAPPTTDPPVLDERSTARN